MKNLKSATHLSCALDECESPFVMWADRGGGRVAHPPLQ